MGIHDFSAAIYSHGDLEGSQMLDVPTKEPKPIHDENQLATAWLQPPRGEDEPDEEMFLLEQEQYETDKAEIDEALEGEDIPNPKEIIEDYYDDIFEAGGYETVLEFFIFPQELNVTRENFPQMVKERKYLERFYRPYKYSWDAWDFHNDSEEDWLNYYDPSDPDKEDISIVWKVTEPSREKGGDKPKILDEKPNKQIWVRNFTKYGYENYIEAQTLNPYLSNIDLSYVAYLFDIDYRGKTRKELFDLLKNKFKEEFSLEDDEASSV